MVETTGWLLNRRQSCRLRHFGSETVLYDGTTGDSHLLGDLCAWLVDRLYERPRSADELLKDLSDTLENPADPESLRATIAETLLGLKRRGLVDSCPGESPPYPANGVR